MRILVYEFASGGGMAGRDVPTALAREGAAMLTALVADLAALPGHEVSTTTDARFPSTPPRGVERVEIRSPAERKILNTLIESADAVWLIAPETGRGLEHLAASVERRGKRLIGSGAPAIRCAADKASLPRLLRAHDVPHPPTRVLRPGTTWLDARQAAGQLGYPLVVKPARGAGCEGVNLARNPGELRRAMSRARGVAGRMPVLLQRYVTGVPASVSLLADGRRAIALTVNRQLMNGSMPFSYRGGLTPFEHPLASRAAEMAVRTCTAVPGLRGYVGVDVVLTRSDAFVIEINPRLTTAYLGVRAVINGNVAGMAMAACEGILPGAAAVRGAVRFSASGRVSPA
jgi:tyramine---L-glutamate ligase